MRGQNFIKYFLLNLITRAVSPKVFIERILKGNKLLKIRIDNKIEKISWNDICNYIKIVSKGYKFYFRGDIWIAKTNDLKLCSQKLQKLIYALSEDYKKLYKVFDFQEKNVIDIGGYIGETALLFKKWGANKVFVFEPIPENIKDMIYNVRINNYNDHIKVIPVAVGWDGKRELKYNPKTYETPTFGLLEGKKSIILRGWSWNKVLRFAAENNVKIIKADCEGCEKYLLDVNSSLIINVPYWIIEAHSPSIAENISNYLCSLGYKLKVKNYHNNHAFIIYAIFQ